MKFGGVVTLNEDGRYVGIVSTHEQAEKLFLNLPDLAGVICVDVPRSQFCSSAAEAWHFFYSR